MRLNRRRNELTSKTKLSTFALKIDIIYMFAHYLFVGVDPAPFAPTTAIRQCYNACMRAKCWMSQYNDLFNSPSVLNLHLKTCVGVVF